MGRLILFLARKKLGLKLNQHFQFVGQKSDAEYYFTKTAVMKSFRRNNREIVVESGVSLNWIVNKDCKIKVIA